MKAHRCYHILDTPPEQAFDEVTRLASCIRGTPNAIMKLVDGGAEAATNVKTLSGLLPICCYCKVVRNETGYWQQLELYVEKHSEAHFSHGICPTCLEKHFPDPDAPGH